MKKAITSFSIRAAALLALMVLTILIAPSEARAVTVTVVPTDGGTYRVEDNKLYVTPNSEYYLVSVMNEGIGDPLVATGPAGEEPYYQVQPTDNIIITFKKYSTNVHVTFDLNGHNGTTPNAQDLTLGQSVSQPTGIEPDGNLTVCGWSTNKNGTKPYDFSMRLSNALTYDRNNDYYKLKLYAIWADATQDYTVSFNNNDGNGPMIEDVTQRGGSLYTTPECVFTKRDCAFIGWATSADGDVAFSPGQTIFLTSDLTLYAKWANTIANYVVLFNANGGSGMMAGVAQAKTNIEEYTIPACGFTRSGYTFIGWATSADGDVVYQPGQTITITLTGNLTLYAKWGINPTVTFDANDGTGTMNPVTLVNGTRYKIPACVFTKDGYDFIGWATSKDGAVVYQPGQTITLTDDLTLFAKWSEGIIRGACGYVSLQAGLDGTEVTWSLTKSEGSADYDVLTIFSSIVNGDMADYEDGECPWYAYRDQIKTIVIGDGVISIGNRAFKDCTGAISVSFGNSVMDIYDQAFQGCTSLTSVNIPSSVESIMSGVFYGCTGLRSIDIPASVTTIGNDAFHDCSSLASVTVRATTPPQLGSYAFFGNASGRKIYVPSEVLNDYKNAEGWRNYADDILPFDVTYIDADGNMAYCTNYVEVTSDLHVFEGNTWYVVNSDVSMDNIRVYGEASLILCDGATLTLNDLYGRLGNDKITIYGQSGGTGTLKGNNTIVLNHVSLIINGGSVTANGDSSYAIYSIGGNVVINGGSVMATASGDDDAIDCTSGTVTIAEQMIDCTSGTKRVITESIDGHMATALNTFFGDGASVNASFSRSFKENVASTLCLPFPMTSIESGTCYEFTSVNDAWTEVTMTSVNPTSETPLTACKPYLFMPAADGQVDFTGIITNVASSYTAGTTTPDGSPWTFTGTYEEKRWDDTHNSGEIGTIFGFATGQGYEGTDASTAAGVFIRLNSGGIKPFRAYLKYTGSLQARTRGEGGLPETMTVRLVNANGEIQGIGEIKLDTGEVTFDSNAWYDLNGRRLEGKPSEKGIYINGGRKVVIK